MDWPRRAHHRETPPAAAGRVILPPGRLHRRVTDTRTEGPPDPSPVPRTWAQAMLASGVILFVLLILGLLGFYMVALWPHVGIAARVGIVALAAGTAFTFAVFAVSLLFYTLPTVVGLRRPRGTEPAED